MDRDLIGSRRSFLAGAVVAMGVAVAGCLGGDGDDAGETETVRVGPDGEFVFDPSELTIAEGTTVEFVWESDNHNIAVASQPDGAEWDGHETIENEGFETEHTFDVEGTYEYHCQPHLVAGMEGRIVVE